ncbi:hypothetical protein RFI_29055 [Reticulomyxa filosa]|uniref:Uncharacterized protein n=1 Tax=Reticulomyxa filosa TaxID=46433 RepID=X6M309_RETFI|nr:hypothetical protein RFI_29055 [Reticulomyxa filosa]|eukprot:ETO08334.1 hypothetical protein RFI_29055 [Reticulomyxa filosa]
MPTTQSPTKAPVIAGDGVFQCTTSYTYTIDDPTVQDSQVASIVYSAVMAVYKDAKIDSKNIALLQTGDGKHEQKRDNNTNDRRGECRTGDLGSVQREERRHPDEFECEAKSRQRLAEDARLKQKRDEFRRNELKKQEKLDLQVQANVVPVSVEGLDTGVAASTDADRKLSSAQTSEESSTEDSQHDPVDPVNHRQALPLSQLQAQVQLHTLGVHGNLGENNHRSQQPQSSARTPPPPPPIPSLPSEHALDNGSALDNERVLNNANSHPNNHYLMYGL